MHDNRENVATNSPATTRLVLHPRWTKSGYRYAIEYLGELLVISSSDPEHDGARALVARGISGRAETVDKTGKPRMRFDIQRFAERRTVERSSGDLSVEPWRPRPSEISHGGSRTRDADGGGSKAATTAERASLTARGSAR